MRKTLFMVIMERIELKDEIHAGHTESDSGTLELLRVLADADLPKSQRKKVCAKARKLILNSNNKVEVRILDLILQNNHPRYDSFYKRYPDKVKKMLEHDEDENVEGLYCSTDPDNSEHLSKYS